MTMLTKNSGGVSIKVIFIFALLAAVIHVGIKLIPMYIDAGRMEDEMSVKARFAQTLKDEEILTDLEKKAKELGLPLDRDDFTLVRDDGNRKMMISTKWDVTVHFFFNIYPRYTTQVYHFKPSIKEDYSIRL
jgi:hypothetical protein